MLLDVVQRVSFFRLLERIDLDLASRTKASGCPSCGGPLCDAGYRRRIRGGPKDLPEELSVRHGLCCAREGCRRRTLPPSVLFFGRRAYWGVVVVVATVLLQGREGGYSFNKVCRLFGMCRLTLKRWQAWFREELRLTSAWQGFCGQLRRDAVDGEQPTALLTFLERSTGNATTGLVTCLSLLSGGSLEVAQARMAREDAVHAEEGEFRRVEK